MRGRPCDGAEVRRSFFLPLPTSIGIFKSIADPSSIDLSALDVGKMDVPLPMEKLSPRSSDEPRNGYAVLVVTGSFNPPTYMHLRIFELARDALNAEGYSVIGGYMSPVNDAYKKRGLISAEHRIRLCHLACKSSDFVMVDSWEANQSTSQRTLTVLHRVKSILCQERQLSFVGFGDCQKPVLRKEVGNAVSCPCFNDSHETRSERVHQRRWCLQPNMMLLENSDDSLKVMLVCGSDLLQSFGVPGAWIPDQIRIICKDYGVVCIRREGQEIDKIISDDDILSDYRENIKVVDELVPNQISSTRVRECISRGLSIKYLTEDEVVEYIKEHHLYLKSNEE